MAALHTFSIQACQITFGGFTISGFTPDDAITFTPSNDIFEKVIGCDGDMSMSQKAVQWDVEVSLSQTSLTNNVLSAVVNADIISGTGVLPFGFVDPRGATVFTLTAARVMAWPTAAFGSTIKDRKWKLSGVGFGFVGGN